MHRPPDNNISLFQWDGDEIQEGLFQLKQDMALFKPNIVVLLGNVPLKAAKEPLVNTPLKKFTFSNAKWRGSLFLGEKGSPFEGLKCLSTYHPAYCLRDYESTPMLQFDLRKAVKEGSNPLLNLPQRQLHVTLSEPELIHNLRKIRQEKTAVAIDIEGGIDTMSCISFATSPENAFIIPFDGKTDTPQLWRELALTLEDSNVPKILQNSLYDRFVLAFSYGIRVAGVTHDTMLKHWELYSELEKSLGVQCSLYTDEPYYKGDRKSDDGDTFYRYCCRDSAVTLEISNKLDSMLGGSSLDHYRLNMGLLNPLLYMEQRGIRYDVDGAAKRRALLLGKLHENQAKLNALTGHGFSFKSLAEIRNQAAGVMLKKNGSGPYKNKIADWFRFNNLLKEPNPSLTTIGELEDLCEVSLNVDSAKQFQHYLYEILKVPVQYSQVRGQ